MKNEQLVPIVKRGKSVVKCSCLYLSVSLTWVLILPECNSALRKSHFTSQSHISWWSSSPSLVPTHSLLGKSVPTTCGRKRSIWLERDFQENSSRQGLCYSSTSAVPGTWQNWINNCYVKKLNEHNHTSKFLFLGFYWQISIYLTNRSRNRAHEFSIRKLMSKLGQVAMH